MTSAVNNIEGATRLSDKDGAGGIAADRADDVIANGTYGGKSYSCTEPSPDDVQIISLTGGKRYRASIVWTINPNLSNYADQPSSNFDLQIIGSLGNVVAGSYSRDNAFEIVDFTPTTSGSYKIRVARYTCASDPIYMAWSWLQVN